jgi:transcriptional regulator NrdR family protein
LQPKQGRVKRPEIRILEQSRDATGNPVLEGRQDSIDVVMRMAAQQLESRPWQETMVRKSNNQEEQFNPDKIRRSIQNAGADQQLADEITRQIQGSTHSGMTTSEIDSSVQEILKQRDMNAYNNWMQWKKQHQSSR